MTADKEAVGLSRVHMYESKLVYPVITRLLSILFRDCVSLCLSDETLKAVGPFYLVSMPGEEKYPTQG